MSLRRATLDPRSFRPLYVVWELTLRCDQHCTHCGSRALDPRPSELNRAEALAVVDQLAQLGTREVVLIGGEAYLHPAFLDVLRALRGAGIRPELTTGGRGITDALAWEMGKAGLYSASVSVDGLEPTHDLMRATRGGFQAAIAALASLRKAGIRTAANTNLNRLNEGDLEALYETLAPLGIRAWQVQLTAPLGRAADRPAMLLQPWDLLTLVPRIAALKARAFEEHRIVLMPGNNLGYFGPEEVALRSMPGAEDHWQGCQAGRFVMGLESDGAVKGCPSLQTAHYAGRTVREAPLAEIWQQDAPVAFNRDRGVESLWGFCRTCPFAATCRGGCTFTAHGFFGRPGNNPYCHYRARALAREGRRERLIRKTAAPGLPFDGGLFEIVEEPLNAPDPRPPTPRELLRVAPSR